MKFTILSSTWLKESILLKAFYQYTFFLICLLLIGYYSTAQLCQGSLGDPIINYTFGSGNNPGPPLLAAATNYQYVATDCPSDGFYTVRNNTSNCFGSTWHNLSSDHTGDAGGYFMLVNASIQPSAFYLDTVRGLCVNTTFEFAAWVMNVVLNSSCNSNSILPDLTFSIEKTDGTLLQSYNTNGISTTAIPTWNHYGFFFTTPAGITDIVLRITNNAQGGCGNDLALDDITFRPCGPLLTPSITGFPTTNVSFCEGVLNNYQFNCAVSGGFNNPSFQWQRSINNGSWTDIAGANASNYLANYPTTTAPGTYNYRLAVAETGNINSLQCRVNSPLISIVINPLPVTSASNTGPFCAKAAIQLNATGGINYSWTGPAGFTSAIANPVINNAQPVNIGKYYVLVKTGAGCQKTDSTNVMINPAPVATTAFADTTICQGTSVTLVGIGGIVWQWVPSAGLSSTIITNPLATPTDTTLYLFIASNAFNCRDTAFTKVNLIKQPLVSAGPDREIIAGNSIHLNATISGLYQSYWWTPIQYMTNLQSLQPIVNPPMDIDYVLYVEALNSCGLPSDTVHVHVFAQIFIPNAFTPNNDMVNDTWNIPALSAYKNFELVVLNRYGEAVFRASNSNKLWDGKYKGKEQPEGAYTYFLDLKNGFDPIRGSVLIIR